MDTPLYTAILAVIAFGSMASSLYVLWDEWRRPATATYWTSKGVR